MIESFIYWTGVVTILSLGLLVTMFSVYMISFGLTRLLTKELKRTYNHAQLFYVMRIIKEKGYAKAINDVKKVSPREGVE